MIPVSIMTPKEDKKRQKQKGSAGKNVIKIVRFSCTHGEAPALISDGKLYEIRN